MNKRHYAWKILIACCLIQFGALGLTGYAAGLFYVPVCAELGVGRGDLALAQTVQGIVSAFSLLISGRIINRTRHLNWVVALGMTGISAFFALQSLFTSVWQWYLTGALIGFSASFVTTILVPMLVNNWFEDRTGIAFGIAAMCSGLGGAFWTNVGTYVLTGHGWRITYRVIAALAFLCVVPAALLLVKKSPEDMNLRAYGAKDAAPEATAVECTGIEYDTAIRSKTFVLLFLGIACMAFSSGANTHFLAFADSIGLAPALGAVLASVFLVCTAVSKIGLGIINDRFGTLKTCSGILSLLICVYLLIAFANGILPLLFVAVALSSFSVAKDSMMPSLLTKSAFGARPYARLLPKISLSMSLMAAISSSLIGYVYDWTGSYSNAYVLCALFCLLGLVLVRTAFVSGKKLVAHSGT